MTIHEIQRQHVDLRPFRFAGRVLDIGGGGEAVIAQHAQDQVIAIDRSRAELEEAPEVGLKIVMDACELAFLDRSFDNVTCFYSLMYMDFDSVQRAVREACRVLKPGGLLWIWDVEMPSEALAEVFLVRLDIQIAGGLNIDTGYGVLWKRGQSLSSIRQVCEAAGLTTLSGDQHRESFLLQMQKPG